MSENSHGFCAPLKCFDNEDCPYIPFPGWECWTEEVQGECNIEKYECTYDGSHFSNLCKFLVL